MATHKFAVSRRSIVEETFWVEANSWEEATEKAFDGDYDDNNIQTEWIDWADDNFYASEIEPVPICPLHKMVKEYGQV